MRTFYSFRNAKDFQKFLRTKEWKSGELDYITFDGHVYTMHEYDHAGRSIIWANKKLERMVEVQTSDRYRNGYEDAEVFVYHAPYLRDDITYEE